MGTIHCSILIVTMESESNDGPQPILDLRKEHNRIGMLLHRLGDQYSQLVMYPSWLRGHEEESDDEVFTGDDGGVYSSNYTWLTEPPYHSNFMFRLGQAYGFAKTYMDNRPYKEANEILIMLTLKLLQLQSRSDMLSQRDMSSRKAIYPHGQEKCTMADIYYHELIPYLPVSGLVSMVTDYLPTNNRMWVDLLEDRLAVMRTIRLFYMNQSDTHIYMRGKTYSRQILAEMKEVYELCKNQLDIKTPDVFGIDQDFVKNFLTISSNPTPKYNYNDLWAEGTYNQ